MKQIYGFTKDMVGKKISCVIEFTKIDDAEIHFEDDSFFILQNLKNGNSCEEKKGYAYSWKVNGGNESCLRSEGVEDIFLKTKEIINTYDIF